MTDQERFEPVLGRQAVPHHLTAAGGEPSIEIRGSEPGSAGQPGEVGKRRMTPEIAVLAAENQIRITRRRNLPPTVVPMRKAEDEAPRARDLDPLGEPPPLLRVS